MSQADLQRQLSLGFETEKCKIRDLSDFAKPRFVTVTSIGDDEQDGEVLHIKIPGYVRSSESLNVGTDMSTAESCRTGLTQWQMASSAS